jgi:hypothetical protein
MMVSSSLTGSDVLVVQAPPKLLQSQRRGRDHLQAVIVNPGGDSHPFPLLCPDQLDDRVALLPDVRTRLLDTSFERFSRIDDLRHISDGQHHLLAFASADAPDAMSTGNSVPSRRRPASSRPCPMAGPPSRAGSVALPAVDDGVLGRRSTGRPTSSAAKYPNAFCRR